MDHQRMKRLNTPQFLPKMRNHPANHEPEFMMTPLQKIKHQWLWAKAFFR